ncbi:collagen binding domain-containing protein [Alkalicoccobacillus plakortidis]|uniref:SpaA isopeptide-forming pilin-related protein n=1 Tax=Alkalicoccobacillus plakortidis TaxID=444060 RepID=A0ABT0XJ40_9BACI|nr:collagen binding domain-containing protein [Alkalicoccobacillus plakortidis]MCM2675894.1 SpaA isopeptide-forming pilin-related protein [Alkalicoccobacillus plakortidis]
MKKKGMILLLILLFIFQPTLASSGIAMAETKDDRNELNLVVDLVNGNETSLRELNVSKEESFKTLVTISGEASGDDVTEQVEVSEEVTFTGESAGDIHTDEGTVIGTYEVVNQTIALTVLPQEKNVEGFISLDSEWNQEKVEELSGAHELSFKWSTAEQVLSLTFEEVVEEEEVIEEEATEDVSEEQPEEVQEEVAEEEVKEEVKEDEAVDEEVKEEDQEETVEEEVKEDEQEQGTEEEVKEEQQDEEQQEEVTEEEEAEKDEASEATKEEQEEDQAEDEEVTIAAVVSEIEQNIITNVELKNAEGQPIHRDENPDYRPVRGSVANIYMDWALPNGHGYASGSTFTFKLPEEFEVFNEVSGNLDFDGDSVGTFTLAMDNTVVVTFNETIEQLSNIKGTLFFQTKIKEKLEGTVEREIIFEIFDEVIAKIPVLFGTPGGSEIDKKGAADRAYNAQSISWTVDFNKSMSTLQNAVLKDFLEDNLALSPGTVKVYKLNVNVDGSVSQGEELDSSKYSLKESPFEIAFKEELNNAYRVVYDTEITDSEATTYKNDVVLTSSNQDDLKAQATVGTKRGQPLEKRSANYNPNTQTITWEIKYNYNERSISQKDALLKDEFSSSHGLLEDSIKVEQIEIDENGRESVKKVASNYTVTPKGNGFDLQFTEDINQAYKITYQTKSNDRVIDNGNINNKVTVGDKSKDSNQGINHVVINKWHNNGNYRDKTVDWHISINRDSHKMKEVVLNDTFNHKGLTLKEGSFYVKNVATNKELKEGTDYTVVATDDGYTLTFKEDIEHQHDIRYTTYFYFENLIEGKRSFKNTVNVSWKNEQGKTQDKEASSEFWPDEYTQNNGFKNGSYNAQTKEITWNVGVNYDLRKQNNIVVTDEIQGNQQLLPDTIKVYKMEFETWWNGAKKGAQLEAGKDYELIVSDQKFVVTFNGEQTGAYWIEYKTDLKDQLIKNFYDNRAVVTSDTGKALNLDARVSVNHGGSYVNKTGGQSGKLINWKIDINFTQSTVSNAVVNDEQGSNQILLEDSFKLYSTNVAANGNVSKGALLEKGKDYELKIETKEDGSQRFDLSFNNKITSAYILEYQSYINADNGETITNKAKFNGENITTETVESSKSIKVSLTTGGGTGSGERGSLEVKKVDAETGEKLAGAKFTLYDSEGRIAIRSVVTDEDGIARFTNLRYDNYILLEEQAPVGYVIGLQDQEVVKIDGNKNLKVENKKITRHVELSKVDQETNEALDGAEFQLEHKDEGTWKVVAEGLKVENGKLRYEDLEVGEYRFIETKAPSGYILDAEPVKFSIEDFQTEVVKVQKTNEILKGSATLKKVDSVTGKGLESAVFKLVTKDGQVIQEHVTSNEDGVVELTNLRPGEYQLIETQAPEFYQLDTTPIEFTVKAGEKDTLKLPDKKNTLVTGSVKLKKVDGDDKTPLAWGCV